MKQSLESCLSQYTDYELVEFHANLNALFLCCNEDLKIFPLLLRVHFALMLRKKNFVVKKYLMGVEAMLDIPEEYKSKQHG